MSSAGTEIGRTNEEKKIRTEYCNERLPTVLILLNDHYLFHTLLYLLPNSIKLREA